MINTVLGNVLEFKRGYDLTKNELKKGSVPVVGSNGIIGYHNRDNSPIPCLTVGRSGTVGIPHIYDRACWVHNTALYVTDFKGNNPFYLYYLLKNIDLNKVSTSTGVPTLNRNFVHPLKIQFVDNKTIQNKIVTVLKGLDEKIENNNKIFVELELIIKSYYEYWFMQFDFPNEEGKPYKSSGGKMIWNTELKCEIPDGWGAFDFTNTEICQMIQPGVKLFSLKNYLATSNVNNEYINDGNWIEYNNRETRANMQPVEYSIWFAKMKNSIKHISIPFNSAWFTQKYILSTGFVGLSCNEFSFAYVHSIVNSNNFEKRKDSLAHGATQEAINNEDLKNMKFVLPNKTILNAFALIINPFLELKFNKIKENQELISLRDFLLPLLMNGQITFKDLDL